MHIYYIMANSDKFVPTSTFRVVISMTEADNSTDKICVIFNSTILNIVKIS